MNGLYLQGERVGEILTSWVKINVLCIIDQDYQ